MNKTNGKIAEQSRQKLTQGILELMKTYPYADITVTQISQEAELSRKTFYRLYKSKDEILLGYIDSLINKFFKEIRANELHHYWDIVLLYFDFWKKHSEFLLLLKQNELLYLLMQKSYDAAFSIVSITKPYRPTVQEDSCLTYGMSFSVGGVSYMLMKWIEYGMVIEPKIIVDYLHYGLQSEKI